MKREKLRARNDQDLVCSRDPGNEKGTDLRFIQMKEST